MALPALMTTNSTRSSFTSVNLSSLVSSGQNNKEIGYGRKILNSDEINVDDESLTVRRPTAQYSQSNPTSHSNKKSLVVISGQDEVSEPQAVWDREFELRQVNERSFAKFNQEMDILAEYGDKPTEWSRSVSHIQQREMSWVKRVAKSLRPEHIKPEKMTPAQRRTRESGWKPVIVPKEVLQHAREQLALSHKHQCSGSETARRNLDVPLRNLYTAAEVHEKMIAGSTTSFLPPRDGLDDVSERPKSPQKIKEKTTLKLRKASAIIIEDHSVPQAYILSTNNNDEPFVLEKLPSYARGINRKTSNCVYCANVVPLGAEYVPCRLCPLVAHINCIPNVSRFLTPIAQKGIEAATKGTTSLPLSPPLSPTKIGFHRSGVVPRGEKIGCYDPFLTSLRKPIATILPDMLQWVCSFCLSDVQSSELHRRKEIESEELIHRSILSVVLLQSFARMVIYRLRFLRFRRGIQRLQQLFRFRNLVRSTEAARATQRFAFRLKLQHIKIIVSTKRHQDRGFRPFPILLQPEVSGETSAEKFERALATALGKTVGVADEKGSVSNEDEVLIDEEAAAALSEERVSTSPVQSQRVNNTDPMEPFINGYVENPQYARCYKNSQVLPKGTMFLTITVHEMSPDTGASQVIRYDTLLKEVQSIRPAAGSNPLSTKQNVAYNAQQHRQLCSVLSKMSYVPTDEELSLLLDSFEVVNFTAGKPFFLVPYVYADCFVRYTISEVRDWPKAVVLGQSTISLHRMIMRHRVAFITQSVPCAATAENAFAWKPPKRNVECVDGSALLVKFNDPTVEQPIETVAQRSTFHSQTQQVNGSTAVAGADVNFDALPHSEDGVRLTFVLAERKNRRLPSYAQAAARLSENTNPPPVGSAKKDTILSRTYHSSLISWYLISICNTDTAGQGYLFISDTEGSSNTRLCWCILIDQTFMVYSVVRDMPQERYSLDVRSSYASMVSDTVFRVKFTTVTLFFRSNQLTVTDAWFRRLYLLGQSQLSLPYPIYMKRRTTMNNSVKSDSLTGRSLPKSGYPTQNRGTSTITNYANRDDSSSHATTKIDSLLSEIDAELHAYDSQSLQRHIDALVNPNGIDNTLKTLRRKPITP